MSRRVPWIAAAVFWLFVTAMYDFQMFWLSYMPGEHLNLREVYAWQTPYFLLWFPLTLVIWRATSGWIPDSPGAWARVIALHVPMFAAVTSAHLLLTILAVRLLGQLAEPFGTALLMQFRSRLHLELLVYTAAAGTGAAIVLHDRFRDRQLAAAKLEAELASAKLDALRAQLQPHFLFNSLHGIASVARTGDTAAVVRLIAGFSDILRHLLAHGERHLPLGDELQLVERYLELQRVRFADRLQITIALDPDAAAARVPLLVVQPLVENALRHGLAPRVGPMSLAVRAARDNGAVRIVVEDTGHGLPEAWSLETTSGTGLRNLATRLAVEYGAAGTLHVSRRTGGGVTATITIPYAAS